MTALLLAALAASAFPPPQALPDTFPPVGREAVEALVFPPLVFEPPEAGEYEVLGVPVYHLHDPSLPLVDFFVQMRGGIGHFPREDMAPISALTSLLRTGGTLSLPPDSVDLRIDLLALQLSVSGGGGGTFAGLNALTPAFDEGIALLREMLLEPGFDEEAVEVWRGQELERIRRREDDPGGLAFSEFNRLMYGDHPTGWVLVEDDLSPERFSVPRLREVHSQLICRDRMILGVSGDLSWEEAEPRAREFLAPWPECPSELPDPPAPEIRNERGVFILPKAVEQSTVIMAHPGGVLQADSPEYFASRIADYILGGGGFTSRIMSRVRTEAGLAYGASSVWTSARRYEGIVGALTQTRPERTIEATRLLLEILEDFRGVPPLEEEVEAALEETLNGFVFAFESASQIVSRRMSYRGQELPHSWLERQLEGLQEVTPQAIAEVTGRYLDPSRLTILIVGDPDRFDPGLESLGPLYELSPDGSYRPWPGSTQEPRAPAEPRTIGSVDRLDPRLDAIIPPDAALEVLAEGHAWVEGPLWVSALGGLLYSDIPNNAIYLWREGGGPTLWLRPAGYTGSVARGGELGSNGLLLDREGRLLLAQHGDRRVARLAAPFNAPAPRFETLAESFEGRRLNSPNDLAVRSNGEIYFTDPPYGLEGGAGDPARELDHFGVYRILADGTLELLTDEIPRPNGIAFSPDERTLYVSSSGGGMAQIRAYDLTAEGRLAAGRDFYPSWGDGMAVDQAGNVYVGGPGGGVLILAPDGTHLGTLRTTQRTSNVAFGEDGSTLFITADTQLLRVRLRTRGVGF